MQFRCFVKSNELVWICQREVTTFYPLLVNDKELIKGLIGDFFDDNVRNVFELEDYTFDVYVTKERRVKVVDFNTWCGSTLPLMYSWEELERRVSGEFGLRIVESRRGVLPGLKTAVPYDYIDVSSGSGWNQVFRKAQEDENESSDVVA